MCSFSGNRGVKYVYVQPVPNNLCCAQCGGVLNEPVQASCGERFHQGCFKTLIKLVLLKHAMHGKSVPLYIPESPDASMSRKQLKLSGLSSFLGTTGGL